RIAILQNGAARVRVEKSQMVNPCDLVVARGAVWRVLGIERGEACRALRLVRVHPPPAGQRRTLIEPFDRVRPLDATRRTRVVSRRAGVITAATLAASDRTWREPESLTAATATDLLPWQLVPSLVLFGGTTRRVLLADAVGLGKTIQAGVVIRE